MAADEAVWAFTGSSPSGSDGISSPMSSMVRPASRGGAHSCSSTTWAVTARTSQSAFGVGLAHASSPTPSSRRPNASVDSRNHDLTSAMRLPLCSHAGSSTGSEQRLLVPFDAAELVVVHLDAHDPPGLGEHPGLGLDDLGHEHTPDGPERGVPVHALQVPGQLLDAVDLPPPLHLDSPRVAVGVPAQEVDRSDVGGPFPAHQGEAV